MSSYSVNMEASFPNGVDVFGLKTLILDDPLITTELTSVSNTGIDLIFTFAAPLSAPELAAFNSIIANYQPFALFLDPLVIIRDQRTSGTSASTLSANQWDIRPLNTIIGTNYISWITLDPATDTFHLEEGVYLVTATAALAVTTSGTVHQLRLQNVTTNVTALAGVNSGATIVTISGKLTVPSTGETYQLQHWFTPFLPEPSTLPQGLPVSSGEPEIYTEIQITRTDQ